MKVIYDPAMEYCPFCQKAGAIVKLVKGERTPAKFCEFHGQITHKEHTESAELDVERRRGWRFGLE